MPSQQRPLARLVRNPDAAQGMPPYALADQTGTIQRYVEPVPGIDLEPYVGYAVIVRHDTGRTLLASQLELPGPDFEPTIDVQDAVDAKERGARNDEARMTNEGSSSFIPLLAPRSSFWAVRPAQYAQGTMPPVIIQPAAPTTMTPQGVVPFNPMDPSMMGGQWGDVPPGAGPIYLDGPNACGPDGCPTCTCQTPQMMMPGQPYQPCPTCQPAVYQPPPPRPLRWSAWGEVLWLHPTGVDMAHAQQQNGIGGAGTVPFGQIGVVDPDYDLGFRIGGEYRFAPTDAVFVSYTWFEGNAVSSLEAPIIGGGGGAVGSLVHHPETQLTASAGPVDATYDVDFQLGEIAYRYFVVCQPTGEVSVFFGGRYGNLDQRFAQTGVFGGGSAGTIDTTTNLDFDGGGPMAGMTGELLIGNTRFSAYGRALVAALTGEFRGHYRQLNSTTDTLLAEVFWNDDRIVPMLDYELGIAWTARKGRVRLAAGYMTSFWFNAVTTPVFVDAVQADNYVDIADTVAFDSLVGRAEVRW